MPHRSRAVGGVTPTDAGARLTVWRSVFLAVLLVPVAGCEFLDREVTPRFPDGLTVLDAYGQWLFRRDAGPRRQRSKVLVILHEDTPGRRADIEAIRLAWKRATQHQSVLWSQQPATVSF